MIVYASIAVPGHGVQCWELVHTSIRTNLKLWCARSVAQLEMIQSP